MPKKFADPAKRKNNQLSFTLPSGAREVLDQLVSTGVVGDSHSEVVAYIVKSKLETMVGTWKLKIPASGKKDSEPDA